MNSEHEHETERNNESYVTQDAALTDCGRNPLPNNFVARPPHATAQARVLFSGLSLFCFNPAADRAEIGYIKAMHEDLRIEIYERGNPRPIWPTVADPLPFPNTTDITININSGTTGIGSRFEQNPLTDPEDFRQMPSFQYWHGQRLPHKGSIEALLTARINVMNGIFYTYQKSSNPAIEIKTRKSDGAEQFHNLGPIGRIMGADIFSGASELIIDLSTPGHTYRKTLPNTAGTQYTIVLSTRPTDHGHLHLKYIYDHVLDNQDAYEYNLQFEPPEDPWHYKVFAVRSSCLYYTEFSEELEKMNFDEMEFFDSIREAEAKGYKSAEKSGDRSVQFACECFDGSCPPLPNIP